MPLSEEVDDRFEWLAQVVPETCVSNSLQELNLTLL